MSHQFNTRPSRDAPLHAGCIVCSADMKMLAGSNLTKWDTSFLRTPFLLQIQRTVEQDIMKSHGNA